MMNRNNTLYLVVPCYNEEAVLPETARRLKEKFSQLIDSRKISPDSRVVFVNDGSKDGTWSLIRGLHERDSLFSGVNLSRNRGHQFALLAGLMTVRELCDMTVSMDADLQDDVDALDQFVEKYQQGCEIVYGVRSSRASDSWFKRSTAQGFYKFLSALGVDVVYNHADYRLMSRRALAELANYREVNLFLRGIMPLIGFQTDIVTYERHERFAGESKYPLKKMIALAIEGVTSFSIKPIQMIVAGGACISGVSLLTLLGFLIAGIAGHGVTKTALLLASMWLIGGLQLLATGIVGEYVGKTYLETKDRPRYIVQEFLHDD